MSILKAIQICASIFKKHNLQVGLYKHSFSLVYVYFITHEQDFTRIQKLKPVFKKQHVKMIVRNNIIKLVYTCPQSKTKSEFEVFSFCLIGSSIIKIKMKDETTKMFRSRDLIPFQQSEFYGIPVLVIYKLGR